MEYKSGRLGLEERRQNVNYEELYGALAPLEKKLKDLAAGLQKSAKAIAKNTESGDLKSLAKELAACQEILKEEETIRNQIEELVEGFDAKEYFDSGDYAGQLMELCREQNVDITGSYPVFEMFPYRVRFEAENQDIYMNRKKVQYMRPLSLVRTVKDSQERLMKANFNAATFLNELAEAYDLALLKSKKPEGADLYLNSLYKLLVPMGRFRRDYDQHSFAYDLARLYMSDVKTTKNGRSYQFGPSRKQEKAIRILDGEGREQFLATIRFF